MVRDEVGFGRVPGSIPSRTLLLGYSTLENFSIRYKIYS